jgi:hypothetical protein
MRVDEDARRCSSNNSDDTACSTMGCSHPHMPMVRCNAMAWTDETEERALLKVLVTRSDPVAGTIAVTDEDSGEGNTQRTADGDRRREALHGAQMVREAVAGDAARSDAQEPPDHQGSGTRRQAPEQVGRVPDEGAAGQGARLERARLRPFERGIGDVPGGARQGVPEGASTLAKSKGETMPWLECLSSGIRESKRLAPFVKLWTQRAARKAAGEGEHEDENDISRDEEEDAV